MSCINDEIIQRFIDGEASPEEVALVENHIGTCDRCAAKIDKQERLAAGVKMAINLLADEDKTAPGIVVTPGPSKKRILTGRRILYLLSAASILTFVLIITRSKESEIRNELTIIQSLDQEYDANKTISQQPLVIHVIGPEGDLTQYYLE